MNKQRIFFVGGYPKGYDTPFHSFTRSGSTLRKLLKLNGLFSKAPSNKTTSKNINSLDEKRSRYRSENILRDINEIMPKVPNMKWGALMNYTPTHPQLRELDKMMPHDKRWHTIIQDHNQVHFDGKTIRRRTAESMT